MAGQASGRMRQGRKRHARRQPRHASVFFYVNNVFTDYAFSLNKGASRL